MSASSPLTQRSRWRHAALLEATGSNTTEGIASAVGISPKTLENWRSDPAYKALVEQERTRAFDALGVALRDQLVLAGTSIRENRIADYNLIRDLARETIEARKADAREQWEAWRVYEAKRADLAAFVEVCREALLECDREDSEAYSLAETDLKKAEGKLSAHIRWSHVSKPPREALIGAMARDVKSVGKEAVEVWKWDDAPLRTLMAADKQAAEDLGQWLQKFKLDVGELQDDQIMRLLVGETADGDADPTRS